MNYVLVKFLLTFTFTGKSTRFVLQWRVKIERKVKMNKERQEIFFYRFKPCLTDRSNKLRTWY